jgi:hypothetical protein
MATSIFLARLIGPIALVIGLALVFNGAVYRTMTQQFLDSFALIFLAGTLTLAAGLATVLSHNVWSADWRVIITVLGWLWVIGGAVRLGAPQFAASMGRSTLANPLTPKIGAAICLLLGALLCFFGYIR